MEHHGLVHQVGVEGVVVPTIGPDDQAIWKPRWRVIVDWPLLGPLRASTVDMDSDAVPYEGILGDEPMITYTLGDAVFRHLDGVAPDVVDAIVADVARLNEAFSRLEPDA